MMWYVTEEHTDSITNNYRFQFIYFGFCAYYIITICATAEEAEEKKGKDSTLIFNCVCLRTKTVM